MRFIEKPAVHIILIALLGLIAYSNTFDVPFQFDDEDYIIQNPTIRDFRYFTEPSKAEGVRFDSESNVPRTRKTRSIAYLTFLAGYKAHGLNVAGYHAVNLLIHILNSFLVYYLVILTFKTPFLGKSTLGERSKYIALFTGLLFVTHPLQTQAVTYISQRFTSLAAMFYLASLAMYAKWRLSPSPPPSLRGRGLRGVWPFYLFSLLSALLAMKTKENSFTLPIAISLYEFMFFSAPLKRRFFHLLPMLLTMAIIPLGLVDFNKPLGEAVADATRTQSTISRYDYFVTQFRVMVTYLGLLVLPVNQNLDYAYPVFHSFFNSQVILSFLFLLFLFSLSAHLYYRSLKTEASLRLIAFGGLWFFLTLSLESGIIALADVIFEHRLYLPSVGAFLVFAVGAILLLKKLNGRKARLLSYTAVAVIPLIFACATYRRNTVWGSEISLWEDVTAKSPEKPRGHNNLGNAYLTKGLNDKALEQFLIAVDLEPNHAEARNNLGIVYKSKGLLSEAFKQFQIAIAINPGFGDAHYNLATAFFSEGLAGKAIEHYKIAIGLKPNFAEAHFNLGMLYRDKGHIHMARREFETAIQIKPDYHKARAWLNSLTNQEKLFDPKTGH